MLELSVNIDFLDRLEEAISPADRFQDVEDERPHLIIKLLMTGGIKLFVP